MSGQGCPRTIASNGVSRAETAGVSSEKFRLSREWLCAVLVAGIMLSLSAWTSSVVGQSLPEAPSGATGAQINLRLRVSLGGGAARRWVGHVTVEGAARFANGLPRGLSAGANAAMQLQPNRIVVLPHVETNYNAMDVSLSGSPTSIVNVDLAPADQPDQRRVYSVQLGDLVAGGDHRALDQTGNRCSISRVPGDRLRFDIDRPHLIFRPGEPIRFSVSANRTSFASTACQCRVAVTKARQSKSGIIPWAASVALACDATGSADAVPMRVDAPVDEGVYDLTLDLQPSGFSGGLVRQPKVSRKVQFVVLGETVPPEPTSRFKREGWKQHSRFSASELMNPNSVGWSNELTNSIAHLKTGKLGAKRARHGYANARRQLVETVHGAALEFEPGGWQAVPISAPAGRGPCLIEIDCVVAGDAALGISLLQFDAAGQVSTLPQDSGLISERSIVENESPTVQTYRLYHWPNELAAWLVLANRHPNHSSKVLNVRVLTGPARIPIPNGLNAAKSKSNSGVSLPRRGMMALLEAPTFVENFGASEYLDSSLGQSLDDWVTFYQGVDRLIQHLKARNLAGAFVTVAADGSGLYPGQLLQPGPLYDTGCFLAAGNDPIRKDVVELMFRMFEREQLKLVPVLSLNGPLPGIDSTGEAEMFDYNGRMLPAEGANRLPRYNPLAPTVQVAVERVLEELVERYQHHDSFRGVAMACSPDTVTLLPGENWGYDRSTMERFLASINSEDVDRENLKSREDVAGFLTGPQRENWLKWRAAQMSAFYQRLGGIVSENLKDGTLYLAPVDLYRNAEVATLLNPALHSSSDYFNAMLKMGFDLSWLSDEASNQSMVVLNPHRVSPSDSLASQRVDVHVDALDQMNELFRSRKNPGDLFAHRSGWVHFAQLEQEPPFRNQQNPLMRRQQLMPAGDLNRRRFIERLFATDTQMLVDSSWAIPAVEGEQLTELGRVYSQLPSTRFADVLAVDSDGTSEIPNRSLPVVVRQVSTKNGAWFYAVNSSPWPINVRVQLNQTDAAATDGVRISQTFESISETLLTSDQLKPFDDGGKRFVEFSVPAWSLVAGRSNDAKAGLSAYSVEFPADADLQLKKRIYRLQSLLVRSTEAKPIDGLANPGFEAEVGEAASHDEPTGAASNLPLAGWTHGPGGIGADNVQRATSDAYQGASAIKLVNKDNVPVWIRSNEFSAPETGRLSVSAWLKMEQSDRPLPLRISLEGKSGSATYYRFGEIGNKLATDKVDRAGSQWQRFAVHFDDLPIENLDRLRVGFDLMGPGSVMIDNVEIFDRWFDENDSKAITQLLATASTLLSTPATYDRCRRLLESYWPRFLTKHFEEQELLGELARKGQPSGSVAEEGNEPERKVRARAVSWPMRKTVNEEIENRKIENQEIEGSGQPVQGPIQEPAPESQRTEGSGQRFGSPSKGSGGNRKLRFRSVFGPRTPASP